jgi:hypothetical protein
VHPSSDSADSILLTADTSEKERRSLAEMYMAGGDSRAQTLPTANVSAKKSKLVKPVYEIILLHCDIIKEAFWGEHPNVLCDS